MLYKSDPYQNRLLLEQVFTGEMEIHYFTINFCVWQLFFNLWSVGVLPQSI